MTAQRFPVVSLSVFLAISAFLASFAGDAALAATKTQRCEAYAHKMARASPTRGGPVRGAVVGGAIGSFSASAGAGAALGAGVGATRRVAQRGRSYRTYFDRCMAR